MAWSDTPLSAIARCPLSADPGPDGRGQHPGAGRRGLRRRRPRLTRRGDASPDALREQLAAVRELTWEPFAVNLFAPLTTPEAPEAVAAMLERIAPRRERLGLGPRVRRPRRRRPFEAQLEVLLAEPPAVFSITFGLPPAAALAALHDAGVTVIGTATTSAEATAVEEAGCDAVAAQGSEAGGHRGTFATDFDAALVGTMALVPHARVVGRLSRRGTRRVQPPNVIRTTVWVVWMTLGAGCGFPAARRRTGSAAPRRSRRSIASSRRSRSRRRRGPRSRRGGRGGHDAVARHDEREAVASERGPDLAGFARRPDPRGELPIGHRRPGGMARAQEPTRRSNSGRRPRSSSTPARSAGSPSSSATILSTRTDGGRRFASRAPGARRRRLARVRRRERGGAPRRAARARPRRRRIARSPYRTTPCPCPSRSSRFSKRRGADVS